jgi:hypothetical protein
MLLWQFGIFYSYLVFLWPFGIFNGLLVYFSRFGILYQEKSGNPVLKWVSQRKWL